LPDSVPQPKKIFSLQTRVLPRKAGGLCFSEGDETYNRDPADYADMILAGIKISYSRFWGTTRIVL
jgi:hypothetical protein